ncbi:MAG: hypothetical protein AAFX54_07750 [Pseudomonadota bacterium]
MQNVTTDNRSAPTSLNRAQASPKTLFLIGNGPSLKGFDLHRLSTYDTVGMNAAYRYWNNISWRPTYYACLDIVVGLSHKDAISNLIREGTIKRFLLRSNLIDALGEVGKNDRVINFDAAMATEKILGAPVVTTGSHAALWGHVMGYSEIVLLGIDGRYSNIIDGTVRGPGIELEIAKQPENNPNYFFDDYQQAGDRYNVPNPRPALHVEAWQDAGTLLKANNVTTFNANKASAIRCFPFIDLEDYLADGSAVQPAEHNTSLRSTLNLQPDTTGRLSRLGHFIKHEWVASIAPAIILAVSYFAASKISPPGIPLLTIAMITVSISAVWIALLFIRKTIVDHIKALYRRIEALEEYAKADRDQRD